MGMLPNLKLFASRTRPAGADEHVARSSCTLSKRTRREVSDLKMRVSL